MKRIFTVILCLLFLCALALPAWATEATTPTEPMTANPYNSHIMAIICLLVVIFGGVYLLLTFRKRK